MYTVSAAAKAIIPLACTIGGSFLKLSQAEDALHPNKPTDRRLCILVASLRVDSFLNCSENFCPQRQRGRLRLARVRHLSLRLTLPTLHARCSASCRKTRSDGAERALQEPSELALGNVRRRRDDFGQRLDGEWDGERDGRPQSRHSTGCCFMSPADGHVGAI